MSAQGQRPDGSWGPIEPLGWQGGIDFEVCGTGPYVWQAYDEDICVGVGRVRTKIGLWFAIWRARRKLS